MEWYLWDNVPEDIAEKLFPILDEDMSLPEYMLMAYKIGVADGMEMFLKDSIEVETIDEGDERSYV